MMQRRVTAVLMSASGPGGEQGPSVCSVKGKPAFTQAPAGSMKAARSAPKI